MTNDIAFGRFQMRGIRLPERNGLCPPMCPDGCRWKNGKECRKYRACSRGDKLTRWVNFEKCAEQNRPRTDTGNGPHDQQDGLGREIGTWDMESHRDGG
jgi:hypothetical protein